MPDIFVLADDLSGAAEIGGLAYMHGLSVRIVFSLDEQDEFTEQVIILDTNSRNLTPAEAEHKLSVLLSGSFPGKTGLVYKKIDSVLRGPIVTEINLLARASGKKFSCMVPANPSKNRTIKAGKYYINGLPISKTAFKNDPHYPRLSDNVSELITDNTGEIMIGNDPESMPGGKILIPEIESTDDIHAFLQFIDLKDTLLAGGADFFRVILQSIAKENIRNGPNTIDHPLHYHFIIGSNTPASISTREMLVSHGFHLLSMPLSALSEEQSFIQWISDIKKAFREGNRVVIALPQNQIKKKHLRIKATGLLTDAAATMVGLAQKDCWLFIEGGETASLFCRKIGFTSFNIVHVWPERAVLLSINNSDYKIVVKPGSYHWPEEQLSYGMKN